MERLPKRHRYHIENLKQSWEFLCPVCKIVRRSFYWPSPRLKHYIGLGILAVVLTVAFWPVYAIKGMFLIFPIWAVFEFYYRARARQSITCPSCGFDPFLFKYRPKLAKSKMEAFFQEREAKNDKQTDSTGEPLGKDPKPKPTRGSKTPAIETPSTDEPENEEMKAYI